MPSRKFRRDRLHDGDQIFQHRLADLCLELFDSFVQVALYVFPAVRLARGLSHGAGQLLGVRDHTQQHFLLLDFGQLVILFPEKFGSRSISGGFRRAQPQRRVVGKISF